MKNKWHFYKPIKKLNTYEEVERKYPYWDKKNIESIITEKTINENYGINLNNKRIDFSYKNKFEKEEKMR